MEGAGEVWAAGLWAIAKQPAARQSVKTAAMSFLMANNLTPIHPGPQTGAEIFRLPEAQCSHMSTLIGASSSGCCRFHHCR